MSVSKWSYTKRCDHGPCVGDCDICSKAIDAVCGNCKHHRADKDLIWYCTNPDSEFYMDYTEYDDTCEEMEERR